MRGMVILLVFLFVLVDAGALLVWWTHPQGAKKMGLSGDLPFELPVALPWMRKKQSFLRQAPAGGAPQPVAAAAPRQDQPAAQPMRAARPAAQTEAAPMTPMTGMAAVTNKPGNCAGPKACSDYCLDVSHRDECQAYCVKRAHRTECLEWDRLAFSEAKPAAPEAAPQPRTRRRSKREKPETAETGLLGDDAFSGL